MGTACATEAAASCSRARTPAQSGAGGKGRGGVGRSARRGLETCPGRASERGWLPESAGASRPGADGQVVDAGKRSTASSIYGCPPPRHLPVRPPAASLHFALSGAPSRQLGSAVLQCVWVAARPHAPVDEARARARLQRLRPHSRRKRRRRPNSPLRRRPGRGRMGGASRAGRIAAHAIGQLGATAAHAATWRWTCRGTRAATRHPSRPARSARPRPSWRHW
eukprot:scaffold10474_cov122-Isochrysis_galbana.AAC.4